MSHVFLSSEKLMLETVFQENLMAELWRKTWETSCLLLLNNLFYFHLLQKIQVISILAEIISFILKHGVVGS